MQRFRRVKCKYSVNKYKKIEIVFKCKEIPELRDRRPTRETIRSDYRLLPPPLKKKEICVLYLL